MAEYREVVSNLGSHDPVAVEMYKCYKKSLQVLLYKHGT